MNISWPVVPLIRFCRCPFTAVPLRLSMRNLAPLVVLLLIGPALAGCTEELEGPKSNVDNIHIWQDNWGDDTTICQTSVVLEGGEMYVCTFTFSDDDWFVIDLDVDTSTDQVDLITMDDINYQKWQDGEEYYYSTTWSDFETHGGQYGKNVEAPAGDWVVVVVNPLGDD